MGRTLKGGGGGQKCPPQKIIMAMQANMDNYTPFNDILENGAKGGGMMTAAGSAVGWTVGGLVKIISEATKEDLKNKGLIGLLRGEKEKAATQEAESTKPTTNPSAIGLEGTTSTNALVNTRPTIDVTRVNKDGETAAGTLNTSNKEAIGIAKGQVNSAEKPEEDEKKGNTGEQINPVSPEEQLPEDNIEYSVNAVDLNEWKNWYKETQQAAWEREDQIRKETQAREDSAYQRSVADMLAAGINPNLMNVQPANSGGGITTATSGDTTALNAALTHYGDMLEKMLDQAFQGDQKELDRFNDIFGKMLSGIVAVLLTKGKG